jgi:hypothetical protein
MLELTVYEMPNENTLINQTMAKTTKLPTQLRFTTKLKAVFVHRTTQYQKLERNLPHLKVRLSVLPTS